MCRVSSPPFSVHGFANGSPLFCVALMLVRPISAAGRRLPRFYWGAGDHHLGRHRRVERGPCRVYAYDWNNFEPGRSTARQLHRQQFGRRQGGNGRDAQRFFNGGKLHRLRQMARSFGTAAYNAVLSGGDYTNGATAVTNYPSTISRAAHLYATEFLGGTIHAAALFPATRASLAPAAIPSRSNYANTNSAGEQGGNSRPGFVSRQRHDTVVHRHGQRLDADERFGPCATSTNLRLLERN